MKARFQCVRVRAQARVHSRACPGQFAFAPASPRLLRSASRRPPASAHAFATASEQAPGQAEHPAAIRQDAPRQQRSLGSERGLATPSPDGKGEIPLGPSVKIMPVDSYSTLGRSCEPAFKWIRQAQPSPGPGPAAVPGAARAAVSGARGWLVRAGRPRGELLVHLTGKLTRGPAGQIPGLIR